MSEPLLDTDDAAVLVDALAVLRRIGARAHRVTLTSHEVVEASHVTRVVVAGEAASDAVFNVLNIFDAYLSSPVAEDAIEADRARQRDERRERAA